MMTKQLDEDTLLISEGILLSSFKRVCYFCKSK
jgi:hypothetical protein